MLYIPSPDNQLYALNSTTGIKIWSYTTPGAGLFNPLIDEINNVLYVVSENYSLYCFRTNVQTPTLLWKFTATANLYFPVLDLPNSRVYIACDDDNLYAISTLDGSLKWKYLNVNGVLESVPIVDESSGFLYGLTIILYLLYYFHYFLLLNHIHHHEDLFIFIVGSANSYLFALNSTDGTVKWSYLTGASISSGVVLGNNNQLYVPSNDYHLYCFNKLTGL